MNLNQIKTLEMARKTIIRISLLVTGLLIAFTACQDDQLNSPASPKDELSIQFKTASKTRFADDLLFDVGDSIGIYSTLWMDMTTPKELLFTGNYRDNIPYYMVSEEDNWSSPTPIKYPIDGRSIDLYAYYPYMPDPMNTDTQLKLSVNPDQSKLADYKKSDFKAAVTKDVNRFSGPFHFDFYHRLSQVKFELVAGEGVDVEFLLGATIRLNNVITDGTYSFTDGRPDSVYAGTNRNDIMPCGGLEIVDNKAVGQAAIIMPQTLTTESAVEISFINSTYTMEFNDPIIFRSGESTLITITFDGDDVEFTTEIKPWDEQPPIEGGYEKFTARISYYCTHFGGKIFDPYWVVEKKEKNNLMKLFDEEPEYPELELSFGQSVWFNPIKTNTIRITIIGEEDAIYKFETDLKLDTANIPKKPSENSILVNPKTFIKNNSVEVKTLADWKVDLNNKISYLSISNCPSFIQLYCNGDYTTSKQDMNIDISQCPILKKLFVNNIKELTFTDFSHNPLLEEITLSKVTYNELNLSYFSNLKKLSLILENYPYNTIDISHNRNLSYLNFEDFNDITHLDISLLDKLEYLNCKNTQISQFDFLSTPSISYINCSGCPINDQALLQMANSLPLRAGEPGEIVVDLNKISLIQDICTEKNWIVSN